MKAITDSEKFTASNAWGKPYTAFKQSFVIEDADVGKKIRHFGGYGASAKTLTISDVGKNLQHLSTLTGWECWGFIT